MKKIFILLLAFITFSCSQAQKTSFSKEALSETLLATDGKQVSFKNILKNHKGKTLVIEVWASWCGDCIKAMPKVKKLQADNPDVDMFSFRWIKRQTNGKKGLQNTKLKVNILWPTIR